MLQVAIDLISYKLQQGIPLYFCTAAMSGLSSSSLKQQQQVRYSSAQHQWFQLYGQVCMAVSGACWEPAYPLVTLKLTLKGHTSQPLETSTIFWGVSAVVAVRPPLENEM